MTPTLVPLTTPDEVETFLAEHPTAGVFKAGTCHKTMQGFGVLETFLKDHDLPVGFIRVVDWRPASNHVAARTGIAHQSPQLIVFRDGEPVFDADNWDITPDRLEPVFERYVAARAEAAPAAADTTSTEPYKALMRAYLGGELPDWAFQDRYVTLFRDDATLRSQREFELLSKLFGDPDAYHGGLHQLGAPQERGELRARVQDLLSQL
ncbi:monothiol bacilliredoxin BrxC family protein [Deinococcus sp.]|uniref:monothiol bacilliredoxin BrxC family protein n=1 Tax=Deinococcus sp. TaxID=47478 RepID=UPI003CC60D17